MLTPIYQSLYDLLSSAIFGGDPSAFTYGAFFCEGIAVIACAFLIALPFLIVWQIIRRFL